LGEAWRLLQRVALTAGLRQALRTLRYQAGGTDMKRLLLAPLAFALLLVAGQSASAQCQKRQVNARGGAHHRAAFFQHHAAFQHHATAQPQVNGKWTVVYAEMDGKKLADKSAMTDVTIRDNVLTCKHDGKEKSFRLSFGPGHMVRCTEMTTGTDGSADKADKADKQKDATAQRRHMHRGVFIASEEFLCFSLNKEEGFRGFRKATRAKDGEDAKATTDKPRAADQDKGDAQDKNNKDKGTAQDKDKGSARDKATAQSKGTERGHPRADFVLILRRGDAVSSEPKR